MAWFLCVTSDYFLLSQLRFQSLIKSSLWFDVPGSHTFKNRLGLCFPAFAGHISVDDNFRKAYRRLAAQAFEIHSFIKKYDSYLFAHIQIACAIYSIKTQSFNPSGHDYILTHIRPTCLSTFCKFWVIISSWLLLLHHFTGDGTN